jgi:hypothetical protein
MLRITNTEKWKDAWFTGLNPTEKLVFLFLTENCDSAGFYEVNLKLMSSLIGIESDVLRKALVTLRRSYLPSSKDSGVSKIWLKKFLFHQNCLPLKGDNDDHVKIKLTLEQNIKYFDGSDEMQSIIDSLQKADPKKRGGSTKVFKPPKWEDFWLYYEEYYKKHFEVDTVDENGGQQLFDHYVSCGWKVGNKKMVDWKAAVRKNIPNHPPKGEVKSQGQKSRKGTVEEASHKFLEKED